MSVSDIVYPSSEKRGVKALRFLNLLDDADNKLSPVKVNLWAANLAVVSTALATALAWLGGHLAGAEQVWTGMGAWLAQAHATHHFDKRERNLRKGEAA